MITATVLLLLAAWPPTRGMFGDDRAVDEHKLGLPWRDRRV